MISLINSEIETIYNNATVVQYHQGNQTWLAWYGGDTVVIYNSNGKCISAFSITELDPITPEKICQAMITRRQAWVSNKEILIDENTNKPVFHYACNGYLEVYTDQLKEPTRK